MTQDPKKAARTREAERSEASAMPPSRVTRYLQSLEDAIERLAAFAGARAGFGALFLVAICAACFLPGLFDIPPVDRTEARYAQVAKQMLESGDFLTPRYRHLATFEKPTGLYWLQAAIVGLMGPSVYAEIWAYRLPSLIGAVLSVLITWWGAGRLFGPRVGLMAAALLAGNIIIVVQAHLALESAVLLAFAAGAQWLLAALYLDGDGRSARGTAFLFWAVLGASVNFGALTVPLLCLTTVVGLVLLERRGDWLRRIGPLWGIPVMLACASPWLAALWLTPETAKLIAQWNDDFLRFLSGPQKMNLKTFPGVFTLMLIAGFLPAIMHLPSAARFGWREKGDAKTRFLIAWILPYLLALELFSGQPPLYMVQVLYPALAVLTIVALQAAMGAERAAHPVTSRTGLWVLAGAGVVALLLILLRYVDQPASPVTFLAAAACLAALIFSVIAKRRALWRSSIMLGVAAVALLAMTLLQLVLPNLPAPWTSVRMAEAASHIRRCLPGRVLAVGYGEPSLIFFTGSDTWRLASVHARAQSAKVLGRPDMRFAFVERRALTGFRASFADAGKPVPARLGCIEGLRSMRTERVSISIHSAEPAEKLEDCALPARFRCAE